MSIPDNTSLAEEFFDSVEVRSGDDRVDNTAIPDIPARYMDPCMQERMTNLMYCLVPIRSESGEF